MIDKPAFRTPNPMSHDAFVPGLSHRNLNEVRLESGSGDQNRGTPDHRRKYNITFTAANAENGITEVPAGTSRVGGCLGLFANRHLECGGDLGNTAEIITAAIRADVVAGWPGLDAHETNWGYSHPSGPCAFARTEKSTALRQEPCCVSRAAVIRICCRWRR